MKINRSFRHFAMLYTKNGDKLVVFFVNPLRTLRLKKESYRKGAKNAKELFDAVDGIDTFASECNHGQTSSHRCAGCIKV